MDDRTRVQKPAKKPQNGKKAQKRKRRVSGWVVFRRVMLNIVKFCFIVFCIGIMIGSFVAVQVVEYVVAATANDDELLDLDNMAIKQASRAWAFDEDAGEWIIYQEFIGDEYRIWVSLDEIPQNLVDAVVAIEDRDFYNHHGVSFTRTAYALVNELFELEDSTFGASTIDQQLIKNITNDKVVSEDGDMTAGYLRKLREIFRAWGLNNNYSKDQIMEAYLNKMALSGNIAGVQAGALEYFDKDVSELSLAECALIAGITRAPTAYSPFLNPERCLKRRNDVLWQMYDNGFVSEAEYEEAVNSDLGVMERTTSGAVSETFSYFSDLAFKQVVNDLWTQKGRDLYTQGEIINMIYNGGYDIYLTVDLKLQAAMEEMYYHGYEEDGYFTNLTSNGSSYKNLMTVTVTHDSNGNPLDEPFEVLPQSAAASVRYDGSVAAVVGGIGEKEGSRVFSRASDATRQVGSTMKPVATYALGLDYGVITYSKMFTDLPVKSVAGSANSPASNGYNWPSNFGVWTGKSMTIAAAVAESTNTVAVQVGMSVGLPELFDYLVETVEITSMVSPYDENGNVLAVNDLNESSLILGSMSEGISPLELAGAFSVFGGDTELGINYGEFTSLHSYTQVLDSRGSLILKPSIARKQAVSPDTGYIMNKLLQNVLHSGTSLGVLATGRGTAPAGEMASAAKTGTTNNDVDRWLVGMTPYYVTAVWWGYDELYTKTTNLGKWARMEQNVPNQVWKSLMEEVQADKEYKEWPAQPETVIESRFCTITGYIAGSGCPQSSYVGYYSSQLDSASMVCDGNHIHQEEDAAED